MSRPTQSRALAQKRPLLLISIMAALAYYYLEGSALPGLYLILLKGSCVALLAVFAAWRHPGPDARLLAWALGAAALGDMAIELDQTAGGLCFFLYHAMALGVFLRHRRGPLRGVHSWVAGMLVVIPTLGGWLLPADGAGEWDVALYGLALGSMAAGAWSSTFPRPKVGAGAMLFVLSDLLLFAEMGPLMGSDLPRYLVWPIYYLGILLITTGVVDTVCKREPQLRVVSNRS